VFYIQGMKTLLLIAGTALAVIVGQELDGLIPHSVTQCHSVQNDQGTTTVTCVTISGTVHIG